MNKGSATYQALQSNCCNADGVVCSSGGVTQIKWNKLGLDGAIYAADIPRGLVTLDLGSNMLTGDVSFMSNLPNTIVKLDLHDNNLSGEIPAFQSSLEFVDLNKNQISGSIPDVPSGMTSLNLSDNNLSGLAPVIPKGMQDLQFFSNGIKGSIEIFHPRILFIDKNSLIDIKVDDYSSLNPGNCHIGNNALKVDVSYLAPFCDLSDNATPPLIPAPIVSNKPTNATDSKPSPTSTLTNAPTSPTVKLKEPTYIPVKEIWSQNSAAPSESSNDGILITLGALILFAPLLYFLLRRLLCENEKDRPFEASTRAKNSKDDIEIGVEKQESETDTSNSDPLFMSFAASFSSIVSSSIFTISTIARTPQSTRFTLKDFI